MESKVLTADSVSINASETDAQVRKLTEPYLDPRLANYPNKFVAMTVDLDDDPDEPILTFRFWVLSTVWTIIGSAITTMFFFKPFGGELETAAVQLLSWGCGMFMARFLPSHVFNTFGYRWTMNPGPFRIKEHALVSCAYSNSVFVSYALGALNCLELWYERKIHPFWGIMYLTTSLFIGYGTAGLLREHLVTPPHMFYPLQLPTVALFRAMHGHNHIARNGLKFFLIVAAATFAWTWIPQYIMPLLASLPIICWMGHGNPVAYVLGSGTYGFGLLTLSLDYNYITGIISAPLVTPLWVSMTTGVAIIGACWIIYPILYYTNTFDAKSFGAMTTRVYTATGTPYNVTRILTSDFQLNHTALEMYGAPHWAPPYIFRFFWGLTATSATIAFAGFYYGESAWKIAKASLTGRNIRYNDPYLDVMSRYPKVPRFWYMIVLSLSMGFSILTFYQGGFQLPWWGFFVFFFLALILTYPNGLLTAIAGSSPGDTVITDLLAGFLFHGKPMAVMSCFAYANPILGQALSLLSNFKFGYYMKIPERPMFWGQMWTTLLVPLTNYGVQRLVMDNIDHDILKGITPSVSWNALGTRAWYSASILWGIIGPNKMFGQGSEYNFVYYGILIGFTCVAFAYYLQRWRPSFETEYYLNAPILFQAFGFIPLSPMTSFFTGFVVALIFMGYMLRRHPLWWSQNNYLLAMGLGAGVAIQAVFMAFAFSMPGVSFPEWWGNHASFPDRCFPPNDKLPAAMQME